jgi:cytoskeletal protein CcmA (bactofilin family)
MALQQIYWEQIATEDITSGQTINLGSPTAFLEGVYAKNLFLNGEDIGDVINSNNIEDLNQFTASVSQSLEFTGSNLTVKGDMNVLGTFTSIKSETVVLDDNVIELNGGEQSFGGLMIKDPTAPNTVSGSLLWDTLNDRWIAGPLGNEIPLANRNDLIWGDSGSFWAATSDLQVTGSVVIKGDLRVEGQTTMVSQDINQDSLIVSGAMSIIKNQLDAQIRQASLTIENLGSIGDRLNNSIMDLGGF